MLVLRNNMNDKPKLLFYVYFADQTVMPFINEASKFFDVKVLVYREDDKMVGSNRKLETGPNICKCDLNDAGGGSKTI